MRYGDAHKLAAGVAGLRRSERALLEFLLRQVRDESGSTSWPRGTAQIMAEIGYSKAQVNRARSRLVALGLVSIDQKGLGSTRTLHRVVLAAVRGEAPDSHPGEVSVHPGENAIPTDLGCGPDEHTVSSPRAHRVVTTSTPSGLDEHTYTRARPGSVSSSAFTPNPLASEGAFADWRDRCPRAAARGAPCESCRACGTSARARARAAATSQRRAAADERIAAQLAARAELEESRRARSRDGPSPAFLAAKAAAANSSKSESKEDST